MSHVQRVYACVYLLLLPVCPDAGTDIKNHRLVLRALLARSLARFVYSFNVASCCHPSADRLAHTCYPIEEKRREKR